MTPWRAGSIPASDTRRFSSGLTCKLCLKIRSPVIKSPSSRANVQINNNHCIICRRRQQRYPSLSPSEHFAVCVQRSLPPGLQGPFRSLQVTSRQVPVRESPGCRRAIRNMELTHLFSRRYEILNVSVSL